MEVPIVAALIGVGALVIVNIIIAAYGYGRLNQKVCDLCRRMDRLEKITNGINKRDKQK